MQITREQLISKIKQTVDETSKTPAANYYLATMIADALLTCFGETVEIELEDRNTRKRRVLTADSINPIINKSKSTDKASFSKFKKAFPNPTENMWRQAKQAVVMSQRDTHDDA